MNISIFLNKTSKFCVALLSIVSLEIIIYQLPALAKFAGQMVPNAADNLVCYMQNEKGVTLNLEQLCTYKNPPQLLSVKDRQFIEEYKTMLRGYPSASTSLSQSVEKNPTLTIRRALEVCNELKTGIISPSRLNSPAVDADIINSLAPEYYCRELDD